jgi:hypothetical protein
VHVGHKHSETSFITSSQTSTVLQWETHPAKRGRRSEIWMVSPLLPLSQKRTPEHQTHEDDHMHISREIVQ